LRPGLEVFEAPHLLLLHTILVYHRALTSTGWAPRVLIVRLARVPYLDRRGAHALTALSRLCRERRTRLLLSDVQPDAWGGLGREGVLDEVGPGSVFTQWRDAENRARDLLGPGPD
jgi:hypothetical protein